LNNWLVNRLTPAKAKEARWTELATAMEQVWGEFFDPELSRLERLRSSYTADDADLVKKIRQMGDYFSFELPKEADRPIALAWRRLEIEYKDMELILRSVFRRHFGDFPVEWYPLFAPVGQEYGSEFITSDYLLEESWSKNIPPSGYFLTSRGIVGVDKMGLFREGLSKERFRTEARPLVIRTKPLHIVFDGFLWYIRYDLGTFDPILDVTWESWQRIPLLFGPLGSRFDYLEADARRLDVDIFQTRSETERLVDVPFWNAARQYALDRFMVDGFSDLLPVDVMLVVPGISLSGPSTLLYHEQEHSPSFLLQLGIGVTKSFGEEVIPLAPHIKLEKHSHASKKHSLAFQGQDRPALDNYLPDGFSDLLPVDVMRTEVAVCPTHILSVPYAEREYSNKLLLDSDVGLPRQEGIRTSRINASAEIITQRSGEHLMAGDAFCEKETPLDRLPLFDGIGADFAPLDFPYGGYV